MGRPLILDATGKSDSLGRYRPLFGEWPPAVAASMLLVLGLAAVVTFYASVFAAAHAIAADNGGGREMFVPVTLWVCALFVAQGLVPVFRFGFNELPRLASGGLLRVRAAEFGIFVVLLVAGALLLLS